MAEFTYVPSMGFTTDSTPRVSVAKFGDGYSQRVAQGINNLEQSWSLHFGSKSIAEADAIIAFLESKKGYQSFTWLPPGETTEVNVVCAKWSKTYDSSISRSVSATFERVYV